MHKHIVHCALCVQYISACTIILCVHCASMSYIQWVQCTICLFVHCTHCRAIHVSRFQAVHMVAEDFTIRSRNGFGWIPSAKAQLHKQARMCIYTNIGTHNVHTHTHHAHIMHTHAHTCTHRCTHMYIVHTMQIGITYHSTLYTDVRKSIMAREGFEPTTCRL